MDINKVVVTGRLTKDSVLKTVEGKNLVKFSVAVKGGYKEDDPVDFFDCDYWNCSAELAALLVKGKGVCIEGKLRQDRWENNGVKNSKVVITVNNLKLL